ncbi:MAG: AbrB family transcriptional regulator [Rhodocyclaceae bacterium]|jgi:AbrB family looped-hinge helix DNA binding protein|nr:AbrB family transcriptional regulator [Rhodocyclaceae bacterium]
MTVSVSSKGQMVIPKEIRDALGIKPGMQLDVELSPDGNAVTLRPARAGSKQPVSRLFGVLKHGGRPVSVADMGGLAAARRLAEKGKL